MSEGLAYYRKLIDRQQFRLVLDQLDGEWADTRAPDFLVLRALAHAQLGQLAQVESLFHQIHPLRNQLDINAQVDWAAVLLLLNRLEEAEQLLAQALERQTDHDLALARAGYCAMVQGRFAEAEGYLQDSLALAPQRVLVWNNLAAVAAQQQNWPLAQWAIDRGTEYLYSTSGLPDTVLNHWRDLLTLSQLQLWVGSEQFAAAEAWLQEQLSAQQNHVLSEEQFAQWLVEYSQLLAQADRHAQAEECLREYREHFPRNRPILAKLAELAQLQGRFIPAISLLRRAIAGGGGIAEGDEHSQQMVDAETAALWVKLSSASLHRDPKRARRAAEKALELAAQLRQSQSLPEGAPLTLLEAHAAHALGQVELNEELFDTAEGRFTDILAQLPNFVPALNGLASLKMQRGDIDEAHTLYEKIKRLDPVRGYAGLIQARKFPEDDETLERLEQLARQPSLEGTARSSMLFQLAAVREKRKEYDSAFALAEEANNLCGKFLSYDGKTHRNNCARVRHAFRGELYQHRADCGVGSTLPVFVVGMPRSGTTLVEQILSGHSEIFGAGELGVIPQVIQGLNRWERYVGSGRRYPDCVDDLTPYTVEGIANNVLAELREYDSEAKHVVDKLPHNFEHIGLIKLLFPKAKIISVRRDPRDIALSNYFTDYMAKHGGMGFAYDLTNIGEQLADHNLLMHHWQQLFPGEILEIQYEQVVQDLEGSARKMLDYIGVDWEPQVLNFNQVERAVKTASVWQVRQPLYATSMAKWRRYEKHLAPLIAGTNANIRHDPITDMITLPEPGYLTNGVALFNEGRLDEAELSFKKMLHHNPEHAAANYMVGLIYFRKGHLRDGVALVEKALQRCPWKREWRESLIEAYRQLGDEQKVVELQSQANPTAADESEETEQQALLSEQWAHNSRLLSSAEMLE